MSAEGKVGPDERVVAGEHVRSRLFEDELVLVDLAGGEYYSLNAVGTKLWHAVTAGRTPAQAVESLVHEYDVERDAVLGDCLKLLDQLVTRGLLTKVPP